jgi:NADPH:quinone reductase-like Zn-dependent oxidoreductase
MRIGDLLESGDLRPVVDAVLPLPRVAAAYARDVGERQGRGKLVVSMVGVGGEL